MTSTMKVVLSFLQREAVATVTEDRKSKTDMSTQTRAVEKLLKDVVTTMLPEYNGKVYAVGGYVRDKLLGTHPKDIDIVVDVPEDDMAAAETFAKRMAEKIGVTSPNNPTLLKKDYGIYGLALLHPREQDRPFVYDGVDVSGYVLELTPPRLEGPYTQKREPEYVRYATLKEDAQRRDLTVNAIYMDVASGEYKDFVGGMRDLQDKVLKPPAHPGGAEQIYREDPLRIFRIIRFKGKLPGFKIDQRTEELLKRFAKSDEGRTYIDQKVSKERIREELDKILVHPDGNVAAEGLDLMRDMGVLDFVSPTLSKMLDVRHDAVRKWHHGEDVWEHTLEVLKKTPASRKARLAALFHDIGKIVTEKKTVDKEGRPVVMFPQHAEYGVSMAKQIMRELKYPLEDIDSVAKLVHSHMALATEPKTKEEGLRTLRSFLQYMYDDLEDALALIEADQSKDDTEKARLDKIKRDIMALKNDDIRKGLLAPFGGTYRYVDPMSGEEIMKEFAEVTEGPLVGELKARLKRMLMEGRFDDMDARQRAEEARRILGGMASKKGWEKMLKQKVDSDIARKAKSRQEDKEKGLPPRAPKLEDL